MEERRRLINASDVTFLCLPDVASRESVSLVDAGNHRTVVIDASTAFRTHDDWAYGLPELMPAATRASCARAKRIAVPGCHASAFLLAMKPWWPVVSFPRISPHTHTPSPATAAAARK